MGSVPTTLISETVARIEQLIAEGHYGSGDKLPEKTLMTQLDVGRGTIREALRELGSAGLLTIIPNKGAFVRHHDLRQILEISDLRAEMSAYAARLITDNPNPRVLDRLSSLATDMHAIAEAGDAKRYYQLNLLFHDTLMQGCGNKRAEQFYQALVRESHLHRPAVFSSRAALLRSSREHLEIVEAMLKGDTESAEKLTRQHVNAAKMRYISRFELDNGTGSGRPAGLAD